MQQRSYVFRKRHAPAASDAFTAARTIAIGPIEPSLEILDARISLTGPLQQLLRAYKIQIMHALGRHEGTNLCRLVPVIMGMTVKGQDKFPPDRIEIVFVQRQPAH